MSCEGLELVTSCVVSCSDTNSDMRATTTKFRRFSVISSALMVFMGVVIVIYYAPRFQTDPVRASPGISKQSMYTGIFELVLGPLGSFIS